jgi:3-methyladenine DNA glycosylase AlkD
MQEAVTDWLAALEPTLREAGNAERAEGEKAYLKSDLTFIGTGVPVIRSVAKRLRREFPDLGHADLVELVHALWRPPVHELRSLAIAVLEVYRERLEASDLPLIEDLLRQCNTWAHVDWLAVKVAGPLIDRRPDSEAIRERWSRDDWMWLRRSALLSYLETLRAGQGDFESFARLASGMLGEKEFFIRKAIGWILRDVARKRPELTTGFLDAHLERVSGLTLREGARHLPAGDREALLEAYQACKASKRTRA